MFHTKKKYKKPNITYVKINIQSDYLIHFTIISLDRREISDRRFF